MRTLLENLPSSHSVEQCNLQMPFQTQLSLQRTMAIRLLLKSKGSKGLLGRELVRKRFSQVRTTADTGNGEVWISANWACPVPYLSLPWEKELWISQPAWFQLIERTTAIRSDYIVSFFVQAENKYTIEDTILAKININMNILYKI